MTKPRQEIIDKGLADLAEERASVESLLVQSVLPDCGLAACQFLILRSHRPSIDSIGDSPLRTLTRHIRDTML